MGGWVIALVAAGVVLVAACRAGTDRARSCSAPTVYSSHNLPSDAITGFTVSCPVRVLRRQRRRLEARDPARRC